MVSNPGFKDFQQSITLEDNIKLDLQLDSGEDEKRTGKIDEVVTSGIKKDKNLTSAQMGTETLSIKNIEKLPVLFGEKI